MTTEVEIVFLDSGRSPKCPPNPKYPEGIVVDFSQGFGEVDRCIVDVPYPAPRCGAYHVHCKQCGLVVAMTVAGRVDDPRTVVLPCKPDKRRIN